MVIMIKETAIEDRPRERLINYGAEALSNTELLAIILRSGTRSEPVTSLAARILNTFENDLCCLARASVGELTKITGIGPAKAVEIIAAFTLAKRLQTTGKNSKPKISSPQEAAEYLFHSLRPLKQEEFHVVLLDTKNRVIKSVLITKGVLDSSLVHPREVFREAIQANCQKIVLAHNHPSGDPTPSSHDIKATNQLVKAGDILGIKVIDHIIIGSGEIHNGLGYTSLKERGDID